MCCSHVGSPYIPTGKEINSCDWPGHVRAVGLLAAVLAAVLATLLNLEVSQTITRLTSTRLELDKRHRLCSDNNVTTVK